MSDKARDDVTGTETTGHEWDGIRELDTPLPRWWLWVFYATILWSVGYWIVMPAWPLVENYSRGVLGYSQRATVAEEIAAARAAQSGYLEKIARLPLDEVRKDPDLLAFALGGGRSAFAVNCSQCHGSGGAGAKSYPNLVDDDWMWGGSLADIEHTIRVGIRSDHPKTRASEMPAFQRDGILDGAKVSDVADYVLSLSGKGGDAAAVARGRALFAENCVACHGEQGRGKVEFGAPNLADGIWLYGGDKAAISATIANSRRGVMPNWEGRLDPVTIKLLAIYVHALGGGK